MEKTVKMLLIEERAGKDIRTVLREAFRDGGTIQRAADLVAERYRVPLTFGLFSDWVEAGRGEYQKDLVFPGFSEEPSDYAEAATV